MLIIILKIKYWSYATNHEASCYAVEVRFSLELCEEVRVLGRDAVGLQDGHPHGEVLPDLQVVREIVQRLLFLVLHPGVDLFFCKQTKLR